jgi:hypothetical protein
VIKYSNLNQKEGEVVEEVEKQKEGEVGEVVEGVGN